MKLISHFLNILIGTGILFLFLFLILWGGRMAVESNIMLIFSALLGIIAFSSYIGAIHKKRHISGDFISNNHKKILNEFQFIFIFIMGIIISIYILLFLPLFVAELDMLNFLLPLSNFITWFYLIEGIFCCILAIIMYYKKRDS